MTKQDKFQTMKAMEVALQKHVKNYVGRLAEYDTIDDMKDAYGGEVPVVEKTRISESIKLYNEINQYKNSFGKIPDLDYFGSVHWQDQLSAQRKMSGNNLDMKLYAEGDGGQITIHNTLSNTHSIVEFDIAFDKQGKTGHVQLSAEGKEMFPQLESVLRSRLLANGDSVGISSILEGHDVIDTKWMLGVINDLRDPNSVFATIAEATGPFNTTFIPEATKPEIDEGDFQPK